VSFDTTVHDQTYGVEIRQREFAWLDVPGAELSKAPRQSAASPVVQVGAKVERLRTGFYNISGGAVDPSGDYYFVDAHWQRIYRWSPLGEAAFGCSRQRPDPANLAFDKSGNLIVTSMSGNGTVYTFKPAARIPRYLTQATACTAAIWCYGVYTCQRLAHQQVRFDEAYESLRVAGRDDVPADGAGFSGRSGELRHKKQRAVA